MFGSRRLQTLTCVFAIFWMGSARAANYYVNDTSTTNDVSFNGCSTMGLGNDAPSCGSCAAPCRSLQYAYNNINLTAGDTVYLNTGIYTPPTSTSPILTVNTPSKSGNATNLLTFSGPVGGDGRAALDASNIPLALLDGQGTAYAGVLIQRQGIRLQGFGVTNLTSLNCGATTNLCGSAIRILDGDTVPVFEFIGLHVYGLLNQTTANAIDVDQNNISCTHCLIQNNVFRSTGSSTASAIYVTGVNGGRISGNTVIGWGSGFTTYQPGLMLFGVRNMLIENNLIRDGSSDGISLDTCRPGTICNGTTSQGVIVRNNTFHNNAQVSGAAVSLVAGTGYVLENNIFSVQQNRAISAGGAVTLTSNYNGFFFQGTGTLGRVGTTNYATLISWQTLTYDTNSLVANPLFVSATDFHLQSPAGHYDGFGTFLFETALSSFVDNGNPASPYANERSPNGDRVDLGAYGNTQQNSMTPAHLVKVSGDNQIGPPQAALANSLVVRMIYDSTGNPVSGVTLSCIPSPNDGTCSSPSPTTDTQGQVSFNVISGAPGPYTFTVSAPAASQAGSVVFQARIENGSTMMPGLTLELNGSRLNYRVGASCQASDFSATALLFFIVVFKKSRAVRRHGMRAPRSRPSDAPFLPGLSEARR